MPYYKIRLRQRQKQQQQARKGNNRWADDDEDTSNNTNNVPSKTNFNTPSFIKTSNYPNSSTTLNKPQSNNNYIPTPIHPKKDTRFALEKKLIDDILQPTGIKIKPDETLLAINNLYSEQIEPDFKKELTKKKKKMFEIIEEELRKKYPE